MTTWELNETYSLVRKVFGAEQERLAKASTRSVIDRQSFARYHFSEARRLQRVFERKYLEKNLLIDLCGQNSERSRAEFEVFMVKAGAHATAAIQSVHAIPDLLAHTIYYSTIQHTNPPALSDRAVSVNTVTRHLAQVPALASIAHLLRQSNTGESWNEDWTGERKSFRELHISTFDREGQSFPAVSLQTLLKPEYDRLSSLVIDIGHSLTAHLRKIADQPITGILDND
jgi:hypothetical protein